MDRPDSMHACGTSQPPTPAPINNVSLPISFCPFAVGTTETNYSPTSDTLIEHNENGVENKDGAKVGHLYVTYAWDLSSICSHESWCFREGVHTIWLMWSWLSLYMALRNCHHPQIPLHKISHYLQFLLVLSVPKGNSLRTEALTLI